MHVNTSIVLGTYAQGIFDAAVSRGVLTDATIKTLVNGLVRAYEQSEGEKLPREMHEDKSVGE